MSKYIGEVIRELRKKENITQEKLAEVLNVSFQSVSRWENGLAYPDISLIPVIARYFDVSIDELFDMNHVEKQKRKEELEEKYIHNRKEGMLELCKENMLEARKEFPRDYHIMMNLAEVMDLYENGTSVQKEEYASKRYSEQIYFLCKQTLEDCKDEQERYRAIKLLCNYYIKSGNTAEALQLVRGVADMGHCREVLLGQILSGEEKLHQLQSNILNAIDYVATTMVSIAFQKEYGYTEKLSIDEKIQYVETANKLYYLLMPDENFQYFHRILCWNYRRLAELYILKSNIGTAFEYLLLAEKEAERFDKLKEYQYTALFVNTLEYNPDEYYKCWAGSEQAMLFYRLKEMKSYFENHKGFMEMVKRMERITENVTDICIE